MRSVSSRAPVWGASDLQYRLKTPTLQFQVVPPCGGHLFAVCSGPLRIAVSSRAPVWGASSRDAAVESTEPFQVVPPCGGHRSILQKRDIAIKVSSRAPVWGASR